ncbi:ABC-type antimicrobial peptide transport system, permease component [bacterium A37T11]|nr:ABC-type antimicrobial peptide transport system, permease component [bacterium A37T11]
MKTYFKIAWRNLRKHRLNTFIHIFGLACAFAFTLLIAAYVWQERQVDAPIKNIGRQYILQNDLTGLTTSGMLARALKENYPDLVADFFRFDGINVQLSSGDRHFQESSVIADSSFFRMFGFELEAGDPRTALNEPTQIVLSHETAGQLFGKEQALGKQLEIANFSGEKRLFTISGVLKTQPENSVINLIDNSETRVIFPASSISYFNRQIDSWQNPYIVSYICLQPGISVEKLAMPVEQLIKEHVPADQQKVAKTSLEPLATYHLERGQGSLKHMLYTMSAIAAFILLMACINFINISIHTASRRLKEIAVRKVIGGTRSQLRFQFLAETMLIVLLAAGMATLAYPGLSGLFASVLGKSLPAITSLPTYFWCIVAMGAVLLGFVAGLYPAFRLSSLAILPSIKGKMPASIEGTVLLKGLVTLQFVIAMLVLIASFVIAKQVAVFFGKSLGYDKNYLVTAQVPRDWSPEGLDHMERIRQELNNLSVVEAVTLSYDVPGAMSSGSQNIKGASDASEPIGAELLFSDRHFAETYKIPLLAGDFFSREESAELMDGVVINEALLQKLGYKQAADAIGKSVYFSDNNQPMTITGVSRNFYGNTMQKPVGPTMWVNLKNSNSFRYLSVRLKAGNITQSVIQLEKAWKSLMPDAAFSVDFMEDKLASMYKTELQLQRAGSVATVLALVIVLLGVLGLIAQNLQRRVKEMGIRKVLGASARQIIGLFVKDISLIFVLAVLVAVPLAYLVMQHWLQSYSEKVSLTAIRFIMPVAALAGVTMLLIVIQTWKAAAANPVQSLRDE